MLLSNSELLGEIKAQGPSEATVPRRYYDVRPHFVVGGRNNQFFVLAQTLLKIFSVFKLKPDR